MLRVTGRTDMHHPKRRPLSSLSILWLWAVSPLNVAQYPVLAALSKVTFGGTLWFANPFRARTGGFHFRLSSASTWCLPSSDHMLGVGIIGYGYWGPNVVRNLMEVREAAVRRVVDLRDDRLELVGRRYPAIQAGREVDTVMKDPRIDAVVIATPTASHFELAMQALHAGKHVLVEKPMTATAAEAVRLVVEAERRGLVLMVDHTFIYTPAVRCIRDLITRGDLGQILYYDSTRINLGLFQHDANVIWDLAVHDVSILTYLLDQEPTAIAAVGKSHVAGNPENVAYLTMSFGSDTIAHINVNWLAPVKIRRTIIGGSRKMVVYDDLEPSEKIKVYDKGVDITDDPEQVRKMRIGYRIGDMWAPQLETTEALSALTTHFVDCVLTQRQPDTPGRMGLAVVRVLEAASQSMRRNGEQVDLKAHDRECPFP
jgi:predicted dehydrogenase